MMNLNLDYFAPLLVLLASFILTYIFFIKFEIPGNKWVLAALSLLVALMLASSKDLVNYFYNIIPFFTMLAIFSVFILLMIVFTGFDFKKPLAIILIILAGIIAIVLAFNYFPALNDLLPNSSASGNLGEFKDWLYTDTIKDSIILLISVGLVGFFLIKKD